MQMTTDAGGRASDFAGLQEKEQRHSQEIVEVPLIYVLYWHCWYSGRMGSNGSVGEQVANTFFLPATGNSRVHPLLAIETI